MVRNCARALALLCAVLSLPVAAMEVGVDRPGLDFNVFELRRPDPAACEAQCQAAPNCRAWTYVKPGVQGVRAQCRLKHAVPQPTTRDCCISGVMQATAAPRPTPPHGSSGASNFLKDSTEIVELQGLLAQLDYDPGPADGTDGPRTRRAVRAFQRDSDVRADGALRPRLLDQLRQRAAAAGVARPTAATEPTPTPVPVPAPTPAPSKSGPVGEDLSDLDTF